MYDGIVVIVAGAALTEQGGGQTVVPREARGQPRDELWPGGRRRPGEICLPGGWVGLGPVLLVVQNLISHEVINGEEFLHWVPADQE